jgi:hypothetical protein
MPLQQPCATPHWVLFLLSQQLFLRPSCNPQTNYIGNTLRKSCNGWRAKAMPNYAFERTGSLSSQARVRRVEHCAPSARLKRLRPAAQRER